MTSSWRRVFAALNTNQNTQSAQSIERSFELRLQSRLHDAHFQALITACWPTPTENSIHETIKYLKHRAELETQQYSVLDATEAESAVNIALRSAIDIPGTNVHLIYVRAALTANQLDREFTEQHENMRRRTALARAEFQAERDRLKLLRDYFLSDRPTAMLWWFNGDRQKLSQLTSMGEDFRKAVELLGDVSEHSQYGDQIAAIIEKFLSGLGVQHREYLLGQVASVFRSYESPSLAENLEKLGSLHSNGSSLRPDSEDKAQRPDAGPTRIRPASSP